MNNETTEERSVRLITDRTERLRQSIRDLANGLAKLAEDSDLGHILWPDRITKALEARGILIRDRLADLRKAETATYVAAGHSCWDGSIPSKAPFGWDGTAESAAYQRSEELEELLAPRMRGSLFA